MSVSLPTASRGPHCQLLKSAHISSLQFSLRFLSSESLWLPLLLLSAFTGSCDYIVSMWKIGGNLFILRPHQMVKNLPTMQETGIWSLHWEDPLEKGMATHSSILAWRILGPKEPRGLQSMGSQRVRHDWVTNTCIISTMFINTIIGGQKSCEPKSCLIQTLIEKSNITVIHPANAVHPLYSRHWPRCRLHNREQIETPELQSLGAYIWIGKDANKQGK